MIFLTSDIHGKTESLMKLLDKAHFFEREDNWLYILGDVIDRNGDGGVGLLKWLLLQPNCQLILGNHELMMLANSWMFSEVTEDSLNNIDTRNLIALSSWKHNGAEATIDALVKLSHGERLEILDYLKDAPLYDAVSVNGTDYLLVHGGLGNYAPDKKIDEYSEEELVWERPSLYTEYSKDFITVIGHTPTRFYGEEHKGRMIKTDTWWNIDTGAAGGLEPMLLCLDTMTEYYI